MCSMPGWRHLHFGNIELDVPAELATGSEQGIDGAAAILEGAGLRLTLDASPFADPLTSYESKVGYRSWYEAVGGRRQELMSFDSDDGGSVIAARFRGPVTVVVHVGPGADVEIAMQIIRSILLTDGDTDD